ncbi:DMT family transporter [Klebsiella aerogenes]|uniref:DMT family transporter n=2 Tax=Klebsiella TaxID=570 RepID=UPI001D0D0D82|nr:DMT family transporter [Klebsiella aerogenes]
MMKLSISPQFTGVVLAVMAAFGFSFKAIFVKLAYQAAPVDPVTLLMLRMSMALPFIILAAVPALRRGSALSRKDYALLLMLGVVGYYGSSMLDFMGLQYITAGLERLILYTYPVMTILIGVFFLGRSLTKKLFLAMLFSYSGILIAFYHDLSIATDTGALIKGCLLIFGCALLYATYSAGSEIAIGRIGAIRFSVLALLVSILATQAHFFLSRPVSSMILPWPVYAYSLGMALFSTVLPIFWLSAAISRIGAARAVLIGLVGPMLTIIFSWWLLNEPLSAEQLTGTILVVCGLLVIVKR